MIETRADVPTPEPDWFMPSYQSREFHRFGVVASSAAIYRATKNVTAAEMRFTGH